MGKAIEGAALLAGAFAMGVATYFDPLLVFAPGYMELMGSLVMGGLAMEAGAIAGALTQNRAQNITTRQPASFRQIIYGEQRVGGVMVYESTTGSHLDQYNMIIVLATHEIDSILNLYLDGRQVHWDGSNTNGNVTRNGVNFGGTASGGTYIGPGGQHYNVDGLVYCEARFGDQADGDVITGMTANDPTWASTSNGAPYLGGCAYVYLKVEYDAAMFPTMPEIKFTIRGKNNIIDPRATSTISTPPTVLATPTTLTNGWAGNAQDAAYEEGVDQGYNWGLNSEATPGYSNPAYAYDGNLSTAASVVYRGTHQYAGCIWSFAALGTSPTSLWLNVNSMVDPYSNTGRSAGIWFSLNGGTSWTQIYNSPSHSQTWDAVELSPSQDCSQVRVMAFTDAHDDMGHFVYEIQLATAAQVNASDASNGGLFTTNWALIINDVLTDTKWGLGDVGAVNQDQLIAAANVCDEQIAIAIGGTEANYACNWHYDTSTSPGDVLQTMMSAAAGRLSRIGGEWFIWPAYWTGPTLSFDESALTGKVDWKPYRKFRDLVNCINGTYIAPNYPYNVAGNLYDSNGWYEGTIQNNFPFAFQPTNYPQYAVDTLHGYSSNLYLNQDNGVVLPKEVAQPCVLSVSQAQRCAKVILLRNRQQGTGTLMMNLASWQLQPVDTFYMTFGPQNWTDKLLEVVSTKFSIATDDQGGAGTIRFECGVQETSPAVYEWSVTEELNVYDVPANPQVGISYIVPPPSDLVLISNSSTPNELLASWVPPGDSTVTQINIQYQMAGSTVWLNAPSVSASNFSALLGSLLGGVAYNVQIQSQRANGAVSVWVEATGTVWGQTDTTEQVIATAAGVPIVLNSLEITLLSDGSSSSSGSGRYPPPAPTSSEPNIPASATVVDMLPYTGWQMNHDAGTSGSSTGTTTYPFTAPDGTTVRRFQFTLTDHGGEIYHGDPLRNSAAFNTFCYETVESSPDWSNIVCAEKDLEQANASGAYVDMATQLDGYSGTMDVTENQHWVNTTLLGDPSQRTPNTLHTTRIYVRNNGGGSVTYIGAYFDGTYTPLNITANSQPSAIWGPNILHLQLQYDGKSTGSVASTIYMYVLRVHCWST